jgi:hypothetical protein
MPGKRHTRYRNPAMCDEALHQITPAKEKELLHRTKKEKSKKKGKSQRELIFIPFFPDMDHPEQ